MDIYDSIRPLIIKGDVQNRESVSDDALVEEAIALEKEKYSKSYIMEHFYDALDIVLDNVIHKKGIQQVLDVGSAIGEVVSRVATSRPELSFVSIDIMEGAIEAAKRQYGDFGNIVFKKQDFIHDNIEQKPDLIMCLQTLEHIEDKFLGSFVERFFELADKAVILSVPREPFWCIANLIRFKYWLRLGNSPHHIQHWSKESFLEFVTLKATSSWGVDIETVVLSPLKLWTLVLIIKK